MHPVNTLIENESIKIEKIFNEKNKIKKSSIFLSFFLITLLKRYKKKEGKGVV